MNQRQQDSAAGNLGIVITAVGKDFLCAEMPVDQRTRQPFGILHGGASMLLVETLGGVASFSLVRESGAMAAGIEINGSHVRSASEGRVTATCRPLRIGRSLHFWQVKVRNETGQLCCDARLTVKIIQLRTAKQAQNHVE